MSRCLVMGATGYLGSRLVPLLAAGGHQVRAMKRTAAFRTEPVSADPVRFVQGDATNPDDVRRAVQGVDVVYYLVHSLSRSDFAEVDGRAARVVAVECAAAGVAQIVYVGGIQPRDGAPASAHLASRAEVGDILGTGATPTLALQASMIIGAGSASFELLRQLADVSPLLPQAPWLNRRSKPIAVGDVLHYLTAAADLHSTVDGVFDLAGPEIVTYRQLVQRCARSAGRPWRIPVPTLWSPGLAARLADLLTTVPGSVARPLLDSLEHDLDSADHRIVAHICDPPGGFTSIDQAMRTARGQLPPATGGSESDGRAYLDARSTSCGSTPDALWNVITAIGGDAGWYTLPLVWTLRGALDHMVGGVGLHRGRAPRIEPGDSVDFWTVEERDDEDRRLVLRADMKMPGTTTLTMRARTTGDGDARYEQRIEFRPHGATGHLYWLLQRPAHDLVFSTMARNIAHAAGREGRDGQPG